MKTALVAAMPVANAAESTPPSSLAIRAWSADTVGLADREYE